MAVEEGLKDEGGGYLVYNAAVGLAGVAGLVEDLGGFVRGEAFVPEVDWERGEFAEFVGQGMDFGGLWSDCPVEAEGVADDDCGNVVTAAKAGDGAEVFARVAAALESEDGLRGEAELVRDSYADALGTYVEGEVARRVGLNGHWGLSSAYMGWVVSMVYAQAITMGKG